MAEIVLKNKSDDGHSLEVRYLPEKGMNMVSYKKDGIEVIDQSTKSDFEERFAGLGALIGPHFYRRLPATLPKIDNEEAFPHIAAVKARGADIDPFTHGIGRYAPWQYEHDETSVRATLKGKDIWHDVALKDLEGQDFTMHYNASLTPLGLEIELSVTSDYDSAVGIHYYYHLPRGTGTVKSRVKSKYIAIDKVLDIPETWDYNWETKELTYVLDKDTDFTFHPYPDPTHGEILLDAGDYKLKTTFDSQSEECSYQLWHPKGASFACVEPVSAQDPRHANLTVSSIKIKLQIL